MNKAFQQVYDQAVSLAADVEALRAAFQKLNAENDVLRRQRDSLQQQVMDMASEDAAAWKNIITLFENSPDDHDPAG